MEYLICIFNIFSTNFMCCTINRPKYIDYAQRIHNYRECRLKFHLLYKELNTAEFDCSSVNIRCTLYSFEIILIAHALSCVRLLLVNNHHQPAYITVIYRSIFSIIMNSVCATI